MAQVRLTLVSRRSAYLGSTLHMAGGLTSGECEQLDAEAQECLQSCQKSLQLFRERCVEELHRSVADQLMLELGALAGMCQRLQALRLDLYMRRERLRKHASLSGTGLRQRRPRKKEDILAAQMPAPPSIMITDIQLGREETELPPVSEQTELVRQQEQQTILVHAHTLEEDIKKAEAKV